MAQIQPGHVLIKGARLMDPGKRRAEPTDVLVTDGVIAAIGVGLAAPEGAQVVDAADMIIHPGLINAHTHGHGGLARGQGDKWTLELLLAAAPWITGNRATADKKLTTQIIAAEMVSKGCTAAYDLFYEFPLPSQDGLDAVAEAYAEVGMRAVIAPMVADRTMYEAIPGLYDALPSGLQARVDKLRLKPFGDTVAAMIVLADDDDDLRGIYGHVLRMEGHEVREAANGVDAEAAAFTRPCASSCSGKGSQGGLQPVI